MRETAENGHGHEWEEAGTIDVQKLNGLPYPGEAYANARGELEDSIIRIARSHASNMVLVTA